ncbi:inactive ubiquitin carboxyl-terminal hydrolase MINDY-4B isoform X2 [Halyomorpha halys]|uniref:inactive ubiquitin carboxyl-terminal hydrolase MINDY-4B isoform X2 n=1 Tax=Halyomorpha halys TaxID=286706 RepID=UPI0034D19898
MDNNFFYYHNYSLADDIISEGKKRTMAKKSVESGTKCLEQKWLEMSGLQSIKHQHTRLIDRVLYARQKNGKAPVTGGTPISEETAISLRSVVFGTASAPLRTEWSRTGLGIKSDGDYHLRGTRNTTRGLLTVLQAELIKFLLFDRSNPKGEPPDKLLNATPTRLQEGLLHAICTIIWRAAEKSSAILCLPQEKIYLYQSMEYFQDGITEKLHTFEVKNYDDLEIMVKRYAHLFLEDPGPGALLLLYTCILSRGAQKIITDMDGTRAMLLGPEDEGSLCVVTLMLTGRATPYLHNGVIYVGDEDHYAVPRFGILSRNEIGLLVHCETMQEDIESNVPGSRLKTPSLPIWVIFLSGHFGVMYNTNRELLHNYHAERRFDLIYLTCGGLYYHLTVDTRQAGYTTRVNCEETTVSSISGMEKVIQTKWPDAQVFWNNATAKAS